MSITLCFDFGNTRLKCAIFSGDQMQSIEVLPDDRPAAIRKLIKQWKPEWSILSSVIEHDPRVDQLLEKKTRFHRLDHRSKFPVTTPVGKPETIGADRLALVVAAVELFPQQHNLVIGLGTAVTYNFVDKYQAFLGGGISPGLGMRFRSLKEYTQKLPLIKPDWNFPLVGYDTRTNIQSGVILGLAAEIDGMIGHYEARYTPLNALLCGGDADFIGGFLKTRIFADPDLLFKGLLAISKHNR
jgi:type III pantothenate kinase